ncbi:molecular chaperone DnaJ [Candidatus Pinguicoccus supinus]|uniref:Chaperone protein DnaJ n=1 Tax=Candidatus Pinguicoccus supinus TaxID=2529394 RepID=A0A7T0FXY8_9BACT|nr:molecular chaperone DnaJ [Candidatus Pinguicoccus supinus]
MTSDYYTLLGVTKNASTEEIKKAYRKKALKYHPDRNSGDKDAEESFKKITEAYKVLSNPEKKSQYDRYGHEFFTQQENSGYYGAGANFSNEDPFEVFKEVFGGNSVFENLFSSATNSSNYESRENNLDIKYTLDISLEEVCSGGDREIEYKRYLKCVDCYGKGYPKSSSMLTCMECSGTGFVIINKGFFNIKQSCSNCSGRGVLIREVCNSCTGNGFTSKKVYIKIHIPKGIETGSKLRLKGKGDYGQNDNCGDLYVFINVKDHNFFERSGDDISCIVPLTFKTACLGGSITVPTLSYGNITLNIPKGTQNGTIFKIRNYGLPRINTNLKGHQFVKVEIEIPKKLTKNQEDILKN